MLSEFKTEIIGISAEVAIADEFDIQVTENYRYRADRRVVEMTRKVVKDAFEEYQVPQPLVHIAERQNPVDFTIVGGKILSVKSNQRALGKVAPQNIGQPTATTYWRYFKGFADGELPETYAGKAAMFKRVSIARIDEVMTRYWQNMFECDYLLHFYGFLSKSGELTAAPKFVGFSKKDPPFWERKAFTFTQSAATWNESNSVKYAGVTIGEFQVHVQRDCLKFRFNMDGVAKLTEQNII
jgi:hypothetical protein